MALPDILKVSLEFSPKLGIRELPQLSKHKESNVPGLFIVGDLADAPIIKVALSQGYEVAKRIAQGLSGDGGTDVDVVVVGAGPSGIGAALALQECGVRYVVLEKERPFNTIQNFPKAKLIFAEPRSIETPGNFWFDDASKEHLVDRWSEALDKHMLPIRQPEEVVGIKRQRGHFVVRTRVGEGGLLPGHGLPDGDEISGGSEHSFTARKVILAIGRRGSHRKLGVPGEDLEKVRYNLKDPDDHKGRKVLVVGGGDSAVEAAMACAESGAHVTLSYRKEELSRPKARNKAKFGKMTAAGTLQAELGTQAVEIREDLVVLKRGQERLELPNDDVLIFIGTKLPRAFLEKLGIRMAGHMDAWRAAWIISFALITYCFYCLKAKQTLFPFGPNQPLGWMHEALVVDLGFREVDASFWGTCVYALVVTVFGIRAFRKYPRREQKRRYVSLIIFQCVFLFGIPELLAPLIIDRPWKFYALSVPWPLSIWSLIDAPSWADGNTGIAVGWLAAGALTSFVAIPLYVRKNGQKFCSYLCGCGGLAETLGDFWRHLAPRGKTAQQAEWFGKAILVLAIPVTLLILNDAWGFFAKDALYNTKAFAQQWYGLMVDFWLASVVGVAFYPYLGNRVWCRFLCPLRAYMDILSRRISRISIESNNKCIGCGECNRYCQMGIDVQAYAQTQKSLNNSDTACIQCGICLQVCPMEVLTIGEREVSLNRAAMMG
jgi:thioredoxin reductase/polyferredoxin